MNNRAIAMLQLSRYKDARCCGSESNGNEL
jgi:hypothetical protein